MRALLVLLGLVVIAIVLLMAFGMIDIDQTRNGALPSISIEGGQAPRFKADIGSIGVGVENRTVAVPTVNVEKAGNAAAAAQ